MNTSLTLRSACVFVGVLAAISGSSQDLPVLPPNLDATFWGRANEPYILKITRITAGIDGVTAPQKRSSEMNVYRDSKGRVCTESFYDSGRPMAVSIRDPIKNTFTFMMVVGKTVSTVDLPRTGPPPAGKGWEVERLPSRVIDGISAEGVRFTRTIHQAPDGSDTIVEEDWLSNKLGVVLERKIQSQRTGTTTDTISSFKQTEPDPALFTVPSDYSPPQSVKPAPPQ